MKTHKRKPLLNGILLYYRKFLVYILPLTGDAPKKFLKRGNANYLVHCWEPGLGTRPNYSGSSTHWPCHLGEPLNGFGTRIKTRDNTFLVRLPALKGSDGMLYVQGLSNDKQGCKTVSCDWMERPLYVKQPNSDIQRQRKDQMAPADPSPLPSFQVCILIIS